MKNIIFVSLIALIVALIYQSIVPYGGMHLMHYSFFQSNITIYILGGLLLVVVVVFLIDFSKVKKSPPIDLLDQRLASGEITIEEYQRIKSIINGGV